MGRFATLKKWGPKYGEQKIGSGLFLLFRKRRDSLPSSLVIFKLQAEKTRSRHWKNRIDTTLYFKVPDPTKISGQPEKLDVWVQIDWTIAVQYISLRKCTIGLLISTLISENQGLLQTLEKFQVLQTWIFF